MPTFPSNYLSISKNWIRLVILLLLFPPILSAQTPAIIWQQQYGGTGDDRMNDLISLEDGGYIAAGFTTSSDGDVSENIGGQDGWVLRMDAAGNLLWEAVIGGSDRDVLNAVEATPDGGFLLLGTTFSTEASLGEAKGESDIWLTKLNADGQIMWSKLFGGLLQDIAIDLTAIGEGQYVLAGYTYSSDGNFTENKGDVDACLLVVDAMGNLQWAKTYGGSDGESFISVKFEMQSRQIIAIGLTRSEDGDVLENRGSADYWVLKIDAETGAIVRQNTYGGTLFDRAVEAVQFENGDLAIFGGTLSSNGQVTDNQGQGDLWLIRVGVEGDLIWQKTFGTEIIDNAYSLVQSSDGNLVLLGTNVSLAFPSNQNDVTLYKVDAETGALIWDFEISGSGDDVGNGLAIASTGGICFAGHTDSADGDIGVGGKVHGSHKTWVVRVDDGSTPIESLTGFPDLKWEISPNPAHQAAVFSYQLPLNQTGILRIEDMQGRTVKIYELPESQEENQLILDLTDCASGVYFYHLEIEGQIGGKGKLLVDY